MTDHVYESARQVPGPDDIRGRTEFNQWLAKVDPTVEWDWQPEGLALLAGSVYLAVPAGQWLVRSWRLSDPDDPSTEVDVDWNGADFVLSDGQERRLAAFRRSITNHTPNPATIEAIHRVRIAGAVFAKAIIAAVEVDVDPEALKPAQEQALTRAEEAVMWAVKAIVLATGEPTDGVPAP